MKFFDRLFAVLLNLCILIVTLATPAFIMMSSRDYYRQQFEKNGIYAQVDEQGNIKRTPIYYLGGEKGQITYFTDEQFDEIIDHIIEYLFTDKESFALEMDGVNVSGVMRDDVSVFGETAVKHMEDVRNLLRLCIAITVVAGVALVLFSLYFIARNKCGKGGVLLQSTLIFYGIFLFLIAAFCVWTLIGLFADGFALADYPRLLWRNLHYFLFPDPDKFASSFMNDTLTEILTLDLFMTAVYIILAIVFTVLAVWLVIAGVSDYKVKRKAKRKGRA